MCQRNESDPVVDQAEIEAPAPDRHANAAGKELCGLCGHLTNSKVLKKQVWFCTLQEDSFPCPAPNGACNGFTPKPRVQKAPQVKPAKLTIPPGVTFTYFGRPRRGTLGRKRNLHTGIVTVAMKATDDCHLALGVAFCAPADAFCKDKGRGLAVLRLQNCPIHVPYIYEPRRAAQQAVTALCNREFERLESIGVKLPWRIGQMVPSWAKGIIKNRRVTGISPVQLIFKQELVASLGKLLTLARVRP